MRPLVLCLILVASIASADLFWVTVTRKASNVYKVDGTQIYIITRYCYEYAYSEQAIVSFEEYSYDNKIIFDSGTACQIEAIK